MTAISTLRGRLRPRSRLGWWSVGLAGLVVVLAPLVSLATGLVIRLFIDASYIVTTSDGILLTVPCVVASAGLGFMAILRGDHSPAVLLGTGVMTSITVFLWAEEFIFRV